VAHKALNKIRDPKEKKEIHQDSNIVATKELEKGD
jgi:hypothetical protein